MGLCLFCWAICEGSGVSLVRGWVGMDFVLVESPSVYRRSQIPVAVGCYFQHSTRVLNICPHCSLSISSSQQYLAAENSLSCSSASSRLKILVTWCLRLLIQLQGDPAIQVGFHACVQLRELSAASYDALVLLMNTRWQSLNRTLCMSATSFYIWSS